MSDDVNPRRLEEALVVACAAHVLAPMTRDFLRQEGRIADFNEVQHALGALRSGSSRDLVAIRDRIATLPEVAGDEEINEPSAEMAMYGIVTLYEALLWAASPTGDQKAACLHVVITALQLEDDNEGSDFALQAEQLLTEIREFVADPELAYERVESFGQHLRDALARN